MRQYQYEIKTKDRKTYKFIGHLEDFDIKFLTYENEDDTFYLRIERDNIKRISLVPSKINNNNE